MKHFYLCLLAGLFMLNMGYGQTPKTNLSKANLELLKSLEKQELERQARVEAYLKANPRATVTIKDDLNITHIHDVVDGVVLYRSTENLNAGLTTRTSHLQVGGSLGLDLDGSGMTVGVWDGGPVELTHPEFQNNTNSESRIINIDNALVDGESGPYSSHATHVAGTIAAKGVNNNAKGMATNIQVKSFNWTNDNAEMIQAVNAATDPIVISNHSYGVPVKSNAGETLPAWYMGAYNSAARNVDDIAKNNPKYLIVASAGNSGNTSYEGGMYPGYDKLTTDKNAKNNLVIANANPNIPLFSDDLELNINTGSSQGPTDDLRIKPDIAADGSNVYSTTPGGTYSTFSGTSMSAPNTTGTLALLQQYYHQLHDEYMNSSTLKGLVCHTAVDDITTPGPDPKFGWGFLDARASAQTIMAAENNQAIIDELSLGQNETYTITFSAQAGDKLKATLCWTDMPGGVNSGILNDPTPRLVNDLDLRLTKGEETFFPWKLNYSADTGFSNSKGDNIVDNVEIVEIEAPTSGQYTLTVSHKGVIQGTAGLFQPQIQEFSLIVTGNNISLSTKDNVFSNSLSVYPNPNNGEFTIAFDSSLTNSNDDVKVDIYDISGRLVYKNTFINDSVQFNKTINLTGVAAGVYVANISQGSHMTSQKIIIE